MAMSRVERGNVVVGAGLFSSTVTFTNAFKATTVPDVDLKNYPRSASYYFSAISNTGFTVIFGSVAGVYGETWRYRAEGVDS